MTLQDLLAAVDTLSWDEITQVQQRIDERRRKEAASAAAHADLQAHLQQLLASAEPIDLTAGTMNADDLEAAVVNLRGDFTQAELNAIAETMEAEYIEEDTAYGD